MLQAVASFDKGGAAGVDAFVEHAREQLRP
jgi:hypothetical protein